MRYLEAGDGAGASSSGVAMVDVATSPRAAEPDSALSHDPAQPPLPHELGAFMNLHGFSTVTSWVAGRTVLHMLCDGVQKDAALSIAIHQYVGVVKPSFLSVRAQSEKARGWTALHFLANCPCKDDESRKAHLITALSQAKANLEVTISRDKTPLLTAASTAHVAGCRALIVAGANKLAADVDGNTATDCARCNYRTRKHLEEEAKIPHGANVIGSGRCRFLITNDP